MSYKFSFLFLILLSCFLILEMACRFLPEEILPIRYSYKIQEKKAHCYHHQTQTIRLCPQMDITLTHPLGYSFHLQTDDRGRRIAGSYPLSPNLPVVWVIGDSLSMGFGVDGQKTFASRLMESGYPVLNLASDSLGSQDIYRILTYEYSIIQKENPKMLPKIFFWVFSRSDFLDDWQGHSYLKFQLGKIFCMVNCLRAEWEKYRLARERNDYRESYSEVFQLPEETHPTLQAIKKIYQFSRENHILPAVILAPDWNPATNQLDWNSEYFQSMKRYFLETGFKVIDVTSSYKKANGILWLEGDGHPNARAHEIFYKEAKNFLETIARDPGILQLGN